MMNMQKSRKEAEIIEFVPPAQKPKLSLFDAEFPKNGEFKRQVETIVTGLRTLQEHHEKNAKISERIIDKSVGFLSQPKAVWAEGALVAAWMCFNVLIFSAMRFDPYPFGFLSAVFNIASGFTAVLVLNSNRKEEANIKEQTRLEAQSFELMLKMLASINGKLEELEELSKAKEGSKLYSHAKG